MGEVYQATDTRLKRQVAIKVLPASLAADPDRLTRLQREAETLASVSHPNIAAIYGLEDALNVKGLVMELVEGATLADRLARGPIRSTKRCRSRDRLPRRSRPPTRKASFIEISSRRTSRSVTTEPSRCSTSASRSSPTPPRPVEETSKARPDATKSERLLLPKPLPGGTHVLFTAMNATDWNSANVVMHALDTGERTVLIEGGADARYVGTGHLVYMKAATLMAVPFDLGTRRLTGAGCAHRERHAGDECAERWR